MSVTFVMYYQSGLFQLKWVRVYSVGMFTQVVYSSILFECSVQLCLYLLKPALFGLRSVLTLLKPEIEKKSKGNLKICLVTQVENFTWTMNLIRMTLSQSGSRNVAGLSSCFRCRPVQNTTTFLQRWRSIFHLAWQDNRGESYPPYLWAPCHSAQKGRVLVVTAHIRNGRIGL